MCPQEPHPSAALGWGPFNPLDSEARAQVYSPAHGGPVNSVMERLANKKSIQRSWIIAALVLAAELLLAGIAIGSDQQPVNLAVVLWGLAWLSVGAVPGFLFGIPKVLQRASEASEVQPGKPGAYSQLVNTNLEQVSDWLTKILLGAGLVQLQEMPAAVMRAADYVANGLGNGTSPSFAAALIVLFTIEGFLVGYLCTRLLLARAFRQADMDGLSQSHVEALGALPMPDMSAPVSKELTEAAEALAQMPLSEVRTADLLRWATAQRVLGNRADALRAARIAVDANPGDVRARLEYGIALHHAQKADEALAQFRVAREQILAKGQHELAAAVYGWLTYLCLYCDAPDGFTEAIRTGDEFLARKMPPGDGSVLVNLAAAYGQKARHLAKDGGPDDEYKKTRSRALEVLKLAVDVNKGRWRDRLRELLVKDAPGKNPGDDDLEVFEGDPDFRQAVGLEPISKTGT